MNFTNFPLSVIIASASQLNVRQLNAILLVGENAKSLGSQIEKTLKQFVRNDTKFPFNFQDLPEEEMLKGAEIYLQSYNKITVNLNLLIANLKNFIKLFLHNLTKYCITYTISKI